MRTLRAASTIVFLSAAAAALSASCASKDDNKGLDDPSGGTSGSSANGGGSGTGITLTGGSSGNGGSSASGGSGGSTGGTDTGGTDTGGSSSGGTSGSGAEGGDNGIAECDLSGLGTCGGESVEAVLRTVNMLLVIDKSGSMTDPLGDQTKWEALKSALGAAINNVRAEMNFGLVLYPYDFFNPIPELNCGADCCTVAEGAAAVNVPVTAGTLSVPEIAEQLGDTSPGGGTPTAVALDAALDYFVNGDGAALAGNNYVLLATDGGPNCNADLTCEGDTCTTNLDGACTTDNCCSFSNTRNQCLDDERVMAKLEALTAAGISTFVVGLPGTQQYSAYLDEFAVAGGVPATTGDTSYYAVAETDGVDGLLSVFETITTQLVRSCEIPLTQVPSQPDQVNVAVDCNVVPQDNDDGSGWDYDEPSAPTAVILRGPACERLQENGAQRVDVVFGCPTVR
jgi:hypothetical protein